MDEKRPWKGIEDSIRRRLSVASWFDRLKTPLTVSFLLWGIMTLAVRLWFPAYVQFSLAGILLPFFSCLYVLGSTSPGYTQLSVYTLMDRSLEGDGLLLSMSETGHLKDSWEEKINKNVNPEQINPPGLRPYSFCFLVIPALIFLGISYWIPVPEVSADRSNPSHPVLESNVNQLENNLETLRETHQISREQSRNMEEQLSDLRRSLAELSRSDRNKKENLQSTANRIEENMERTMRNSSMALQRAEQSAARVDQALNRENSKNGNNSSNSSGSNSNDRNGPSSDRTSDTSNQMKNQDLQKYRNSLENSMSELNRYGYSEMKGLQKRMKNIQKATAMNRDPEKTSSIDPEDIQKFRKNVQKFRKELQEQHRKMHKNGTCRAGEFCRFKQGTVRKKGSGPGKREEGKPESPGRLQPREGKPKKSSQEPPMVMTEETQQKKARFKRVSPESQVGPGGSETTGNRVVKGENQEAGSSSRSRGGAGGFETRFESMERPVSPFYRNILQNYYSSPGED